MYIPGGSGHYFNIESSCINESFAELKWEEVQNPHITLSLISIRLTCYNITSPDPTDHEVIQALF